MPVTSPPTALYHVSLITDDPELRQRLTQLLRLPGAEAYELQAASDLDGGLRALADGVADVLLLDARDPAAVEETLAATDPDESAVRPPLVLLVTEEGSGCDLAECLPVAELTPEKLARTLRRTIRYARVVKTLRRAQRELQAQVEAQEAARLEQERQERLFNGIMRHLPLLIGRLDARGRVIEIHGSGLSYGNFRAEMLLHRSLAAVLPEARDSIRQVLEGETANFSVRRRRGGEEWHADFVLMPEHGGERGAIFLGRDVSERRWLEQQLLTTADAEQQRIGADLHDGLGQQLTGLACLVAGLRDRLSTEQHEPLAAQADFIVEVANDATRQSRALARGLCPLQLDGGSLQSALADLTYQAQQLHGIRCTFRGRGELPALDHLTAIHLYRITQEALHNAVRHGLARNVRVMLVSRGPRHRLTITDDGRGFESRRAAPAPGRGLRLMRYRAGMIGGALSILSRPGRGTRVSCQFTHESTPNENPS